MRENRRTSVWHNADFVTLWSGQAISMFGSRVSQVALPLLALDLTSSPTQAGLVVFLESVPNVLLTLPAGALADRWNRKRTMILCDAGRTLALGTIPFVVWVGHLTVVQLAVVAFVEGTLAVFFAAAEAAALPHVVQTTQLPEAMSHNEAASRGAVMLGGAAAGALYGFGRSLPFLADAVSYAASVVSLFFIRPEFQDERTAEGHRFFTEMKEGLAWVWQQPFIRVSTFLVAGSNMIFAALVLVVIVLAKQHHASPAVIGILFSLGGVGGVLGSVASAWLQRRLSLTQAVIGVNWVWAALLPFLAIAGNPFLIGAIFAGMVFVGPVWNVVLGSYETALVPDALRSRVSSVGRLIAWGTIPIGSALSGVALQALGAVSTILVLSGGMLILALAATASRAIRDVVPLGEIGRSSTCASD